MTDNTPLSKTSRETFVDHYGGVFEHSKWIAERAYDLGVDGVMENPPEVHAILCDQFRQANREERLNVLLAHPDLAGKLAAAKRLTADSTKEQAGAGLDALTDNERNEFTRLNETYKSRHGFPFIIAVKGWSKDEILAQFRQRVDNERDVEFDTACQQVERIALLRLTDLLPTE